MKYLILFLDNKKTLFIIYLFSRNKNESFSEQSNKIRFIALKSDDFSEQQFTKKDVIEDKSKNIYTNREKQEIYRLIENKLS